MRLGFCQNQDVCAFAECGLRRGMRCWQESLSVVAIENSGPITVNTTLHVISEEELDDFI